MNTYNIELQRNRLVECLTLAARHTDKDSLLSHVLLRWCGNRITIVATDGKQLIEFVIGCEVSKGAFDESESWDILLHPDDIRKLSALKSSRLSLKKNPSEKLTLELEEKTVRFASDGASVNAERVEGVYPAYENALHLGEGEPAGRIGVNPVYMAQLMTSLAKTLPEGSPVVMTHHAKGRGTILRPMHNRSSGEGVGFFGVTGLIMPVGLP